MTTTTTTTATTCSATPVLSFEDVWYRYSGSTAFALRSVNLTIGAGEWVCVVGTSAAGKSTLARLAAGLHSPSRGRILRPQGASVGFVAQYPGQMQLGATVAEEIALGWRGESVSEAAVAAAMDAVGLPAHLAGRAPHELSGGEQQRLALAGVLARGCRLLVLDEATAMLDWRARRRMVQAVRKAVASGVSVLWLTRDPQVVMAAGRVLVLHRGAVMRQVQPEEVLRRRRCSPAAAAAPRGGCGLGLEAVTLEFAYSPTARRALTGVQMQVAPGTLTAVVGASGSGKSTLLLLLAGLLRATGGRVLYDGRHVCTPEGYRWLRRQVGLALQHPEQQLFARTVLEDVAFAPANLGVKKGEALQMAEKALQLVGLSAAAVGGRSPFALSGGERRLVALAGVLAARPAVLLLDEPTVGLDAEVAAEVWRLVRGAGCTGVVATHDLPLALEHADQVVVLSAGRILMAAAPPEVAAHPAVLDQAGLELGDECLQVETARGEI